MDSTLEPEEQSNVYNNEGYDGDLDKDEMSGDILETAGKRKRSNSPFIRATPIKDYLSDISSGSFQFPQPPSPDLFTQLQNQKVRRGTPPVNRVASPSALSNHNTPTPADSLSNRVPTPVILSNRSTPTPLSTNQLQFRSLNDTFGQPIGLASKEDSLQQVAKPKKKKKKAVPLSITKEALEATELPSTLIPVDKSTSKIINEEPEYAEIKDVVRTVVEIREPERPREVSQPEIKADARIIGTIPTSPASVPAAPQQTLPYAKAGFSSHAFRLNMQPRSMMFESCIEDTDSSRPPDRTSAAAAAKKKEQQMRKAERVSNECASILDTANFHGGSEGSKLPTAAAVAGAGQKTLQQQQQQVSGDGKNGQAVKGTTITKSPTGRNSDSIPTLVSKPSLSGTGDLGMRNPVMGMANTSVTSSSNDSRSQTQQNKSATTTATGSRVSFSIPMSLDRASRHVDIDEVPDYTCHSVAITVFCFIGAAALALHLSVKARKALEEGDTLKAWTLTQRAKSLLIGSVVFGCICWVCAITVICIYLVHPG